MTITGNHIDNNALAALSRQAGPRVSHAIEKASTKTGVDFAYLMEQAAAESSFDTGAKAGTSSATGLYQFIESTWMSMVKQHGHKYGMEKLASQIDDKGRVKDPAVKEQILSLRKNPEKAALLAAEFAAGNKQHLERYVGGKIGSTELYFAHFMGASGATGFLNAMKKNPMSIGADIFPKEANANRNVFYNPKTGEPRTLSQIYDFFDKKFSSGTVSRDTPSTTTKPATVKHYSPRPASFYTQDIVAGNTLPDVSHNAILRLLSNDRTEKQDGFSPFLSFFRPAFSPDLQNLLMLTQSNGSIFR